MTCCVQQTMACAYTRCSTMKDIAATQMLRVAHRYNRLVAQNATSLSRRFTRLHGLQPLLLTELSAMDTARKASLTTLNTLAQHCSNVTQAFVDQVRFCFQCLKYLTCL